MELLSSNSSLMMEQAMRFLWQRQATVLDNISNAETPNYKPKYVTFEDTLKQKLEAAADGPRPKSQVHEVLEGSVAVTRQAQETTRMDDNGVNVATESMELVRTAYQLQYLLQSINGDITTLRSAIRGQ